MIILLLNDHQIRIYSGLSIFDQKVSNTHVSHALQATDPAGCQVNLYEA